MKNRLTYVLLAALMLVTCAGAPAFAAGLNLPPTNRIAADNLPEGYTQTTPPENVFKVEGSDKAFILLDDSGTGSSKYFILAKDGYGTHIFDSDNTQMFDPADANNVAAFLNGAFLTDGNGTNSATGLPNRLPQEIISHVDSGHIWSTEAGHKNSNCPVGYDVTAGVVLLSQYEYLQYVPRIGTHDNLNGGVTNQDPLKGWWLRTGRGKPDDVPTSNVLTFKTIDDGTNAWTANTQQILRPAFWLDEAFFKTVKINVYGIGKNVKQAIISSCSDAELTAVGYSADEIAVLKDAQNNNNEEIDISSGLGTGYIIEGDAAKCAVTIRTTSSTIPQYSVEWGVEGGKTETKSITVTSGIESVTPLTFTFDKEGTYSCFVQLKRAGQPCKELRQTVSYIKPYQNQFLDGLDSRGFSTHFSLENRSDLSELKLLKAAGVKTIRDGLDWNKVEKEKGVYDWSRHDGWVQAATAEGMNIIAGLSFNNTLYCGGNDIKLGPTTQEEIDAYVAYAKEAARHFPQITTFEIWNEPNHNGFWKPEADPVMYAKLVRAVGDALHEVNPAIRVNAGSVSVGGSIKPADYGEYLAALFENGCYGAIDALSYHPYVDPKGADYGALTAHHDKVGAIIRKAGGFVSPSVTEVGWTTMTGSRGVTEQEQARYFVQNYVIGDVYGLEGNAIYDFRDDGTDKTDREHNFGAVRKDYSAKLSYYAVKQFNQMIGGAQYVGKLDLSGVQAHLYQRSGVPVMVAWANSQKTVSLDGSNVTAVGMTGAAAGAGNVVSIGPDPVYVTGLDTKYLAMAAGDSASELLAPFVTRWAAALDEGGDLRARVEAQAAAMASLDAMPTSPQAHNRLKVFYQIGTDVIGAYLDGKLSLSQTELSGLLSDLDDAGRYYEALLAVSAAQDAAPDISQTGAAIHKTQSDISALPQTMTIYPAAVLRRAGTLWSRASRIGQMDSEQGKAGLMKGLDARAAELEKWASAMVVTSLNGFDKPYSRFAVDANTGSVTISGITSARDTNVTIEVLKPGVTQEQILANPTGDLSNLLEYFGQDAVNSEGMYSFAFRMTGGTGTYTWRILGPNNDGVQSGTFDYISPGEIKELMNQIRQSASAEAVGTLMEAGKNLFATGCPLYETLLADGVDLSVLYQAVFAARASIAEPNDLFAIMTEPLAVSALNHAQNGTELESLFKEYSYAVNIEDQKAYATYLNVLDASGRAAVMSRLAAMNAGSAAQWLELFSFTTVSFAVSVSTQYTVMNILTANKDFLGLDFSAYNQLNVSGQAEVARAMAGRSLSSKAELKASFDQAVSDAAASSGQTDQRPSRPSTGGGSGGGTRLPSAGVQITPGTQDEQPGLPFTDLGSASWAQEAISALYEKKIINGKSDSQFDPDGSVTREEFVKMLVLAFDLYDEEAACDFADAAAGDWFYPYLASASAKGVVSGLDDGSFGVGSSISRQDAATMLYRAATKLGTNLTPGELRFADGGSIADYAKDAVSAMAKAGIINGVGDNQFAPADTATRAQAAQMIYQMIH